ncbi:sugar transferase [Agrococcus lahaulensis]|nr:sugar transferase [Agrococcus lahaulensis]
MGSNYDLLKRVLDVAGAGTALVLSSPLIVATAAAVAVSLGRPVLFRQERVGKAGRSFTLVKFRSMRAADPALGITDDADRLSPFGRALRATSLDELPSLWNVLKGDMSMVGPRPLLPEYLPRYTARQARRHEVRPGVTGLAQVRGRNELPWSERFEADIDYVDRRSLGMDARIMLATVGAVLRRRGISAPGHATQSSFQGEDWDDRS